MSDDPRNPYAPPTEREPVAEEEDDSEEDDSEEDDSEEDDSEEDDSEEDEPPPPVRDPVVAGARLAGVLLLIEGGAAAVIGVAYLSQGFGLRWEYLLQVVVLGGLGTAMLTHGRELRVVALVVIGGLALYPVRLLGAAAVAASAEASEPVLEILSDILRMGLVVAAAQILPFVLLLCGRPSANQRRLAALIAVTAMAVSYVPTASALLTLRELRQPAPPP